MGGEKVVVTVLNDNSDPTAAATAARKLITENKVDVLIGSSVTPPSIAIVEVAGESKVPLLSLAGGGAIVEPQEGNRKWAFKFSPTETFSTDLIVAHALKNNVKTVAVIGLANAYGDGFVKNFERIAAAKGLKIVASERYATTDTSVVGQVVKLLAAKPDAIYVAASGTPGALPQIELAQRGWKGPVYQTQGVANNDYLRIGGKALEGTFMTTAPVLVAEQLADSNPIKKPAVEYVTKLRGCVRGRTRARCSARPPGTCSSCSDKVVGRGDRRTAKPGTPEYRAAIRDGMEGLKDFVSAEGFYNDDRQGPQRRRRALPGPGEDRERSLEAGALTAEGRGPSHDPEPRMETVETDCCIAGGGPAGMMLGLLLARRGVQVTVLEKHADFLRDFRGDTIHPSTLEVMSPPRPPRSRCWRFRTRRSSGCRCSGRTETLPGRGLHAAVHALPVHRADAAMGPARPARRAPGARCPGFTLRMRTEARELIGERDAGGAWRRIDGLQAVGPGRPARGPRDGSSSAATAGIRAVRGSRASRSTPSAHRWTSCGSRCPATPTTATRRSVASRTAPIFVLINRGDHWQCGFVIAKGRSTRWQAKGFDAFRAAVARPCRRPFAMSRPASRRCAAGTT